MVLEAVPPRSLSAGLPGVRGRKLSERCAILLAVCWLLAGTGCVDMEMLLRRDVGAPPPACQVVATWCSDVVQTPDPANGGRPVRGIAGRVYLFGSEISNPLVGDGGMVVDLYDVTAGPRPDTPLEEWRFDADTLKRLQRRDAIGPGYTLFLPWGTYKADIKRVQLRVRYVPSKGAPLYTESEGITLHNQATAE
jgi:hypothetical protein